MPSSGGFYTFERLGQELTGTLIGQDELTDRDGKKELRWTFIPLGSSDPMWLPNHYDLDHRLQKLVAKYEGQLPLSGVWIQYRGKRNAPSVQSGYVLVYEVAKLKEGGD